MAKGIYVGVDNVARKVKKAYVGVANSSLVANGDFEKGLDGWTNSYSGILSLTNESNGYSGKCAKLEILTTTTGDTFRYIEFSVNYTENHIYYASCFCKGLSTNVADMNARIRLLSSNSASAVAGEKYFTDNLETWKKLSAYGTITEAGIGRFDLLINTGVGKGITAGMALYYDNVRLYDLTALYGAGNEPTQDWCDNNATELENLYKRKGNGVARKVKKGYIGVGGVARLFYSAEQKLNYYGVTTGLDAGLTGVAATTIGNYALFGGGYGSSSGSKTYQSAVYTYTNKLVRGTTTALSVKRTDLAATSVGNYALFAGGSKSGGKSATVDTYTSTLAKGTATNLTTATYELEATSVGDYAIFAGGYSSKSTVNTYTSALVKGTATDMSEDREYFTATTVGNYALLGGGYISKGIATVDTYNSALVKGTATNLSVGRGKYASTSVGDYAIFAGGLTVSATDTCSDVVDTYTSALVKGTATKLGTARQLLSATSVGDYAIFAGGGKTGAFSNVDVYTSALVHSNGYLLANPRQAMAATSVGDYAIFAGGSDGASTYSNAVEAFQVV